VLTGERSCQQTERGHGAKIARLQTRPPEPCAQVRVLLGAPADDLEKSLNARRHLGTSARIVADQQGSAALRTAVHGLDHL
jgi:hypothetical protein